MDTLYVKKKSGFIAGPELDSLCSFLFVYDAHKACQAVLFSDV